MRRYLEEVGSFEKQFQKHQFCKAKYLLCLQLYETEAIQIVPVMTQLPSNRFFLGFFGFYF